MESTHEYVEKLRENAKRQNATVNEEKELPAPACRQNSIPTILDQRICIKLYSRVINLKYQLNPAAFYAN